MKYQKAPRKSSCISLLFLTPSPYEKKKKNLLENGILRLYYDNWARATGRKKERRKKVMNATRATRRMTWVIICRLTFSNIACVFIIYPKRTQRIWIKIHTRRQTWRQKCPCCEKGAGLRKLWYNKVNKGTTQHERYQTHFSCGVVTLPLFLFLKKNIISGQKNRDASAPSTFVWWRKKESSRSST